MKRLLLFLCPFILTACSWFEDPEGSGLILETQPQPIEATQKVAPNIENKIILKEKVVEAAPLVDAPERKFKFRTPDLINALPSDRDLENTPSFTNKIDDSVEEATTIRATE